MNYLNIDEIKSVSFNLLSLLNKNMMCSETYQKNLKEQMVKTLYTNLIKNEELNNFILNNFNSSIKYDDLKEVINFSHNDVFENINIVLSSFAKEHLNLKYHNIFKLDSNNKNIFLEGINLSVDTNSLIDVLGSVKSNENEFKDKQKIDILRDFLNNMDSSVKSNLFEKLNVNNLFLYCVDKNFSKYINEKLNLEIQNYKNLDIIIEGNYYNFSDDNKLDFDNKGMLERIKEKRIDELNLKSNSVKRKI